MCLVPGRRRPWAGCWLGLAGDDDEAVIHAAPVFLAVQNGVVGVDLNVDKTGPRNQCFKPWGS